MECTCGEMMLHVKLSVLLYANPFDENDERITVQICDRPVQGHMFLSRVYTQPQWIYDCVNAKKLLSVEQYAPGASLPPHLSPFVEYKEGDYIPEAAGFDGEVEEIDEQDVEVAEDEESDSDDEEAENEEEQAPVAINTEESEHQKELEAEAAGVAFSEYQQKRGKKNTKTAPKISKEKQEEVEAKELAKIMMTKKKRQLYNKIQHSKNKTADETNKLKRRKEELAAKAKKQKKA
ncbi:mRNA-binding ribosome synthesis protein nop7 [Basidiobolus ranarum]|uniref:mRNA-binding ribosome synthesis protein nop7 n=1 Tax=Basidiobolus ranarum TaxID=34480 RepID=A0ABR2VXA0_9FUNG